MMKQRLALWAVALAGFCAAHSAQAADTGPVVKQPSANERIDLARDAIKAKDWKKAQIGRASCRERVYSSV